jgi:hypothetical protein
MINFDLPCRVTVPKIRPRSPSRLMLYAVI